MVDVKAAVAAQKNGSEKMTLSTFLESIKETITEVMPDYSEYTVQQFSTSVENSVRKKPELAADLQSLKGAILGLAQFGICPDTKAQEAYLTIDKKTGKATFELYYTGLRDLVYRRYNIISQARMCYEGDKFLLAFGDNQRFEHEPARPQKRGNVEFYYATTVVDGIRYIEILTPDESQAFKNQFAGGSVAWKNNFDAMSKKTVLKRLLKSIPKASQLNELLNSELEESVVSATEQPENTAVISQTKQATIAQTKPVATAPAREKKTSQAKPAATDSEKAAATSQAKPAATAQAKPAATTQAKSVTTTQAKSVATTQAKSVATTQAKPVATTQVKPAATAQVKPAATAQPKTVESDPEPDFDDEISGFDYFGDGEDCDFEL